MKPINPFPPPPPFTLQHRIGFPPKTAHTNISNSFKQFRRRRLQKKE